MKHECNCEFCEYVDTEPSLMNKVIQSISDPQLIAMWALKNSVTGLDRAIVRTEILKRVTILRKFKPKGWCTVGP